MRYKLNIHSYSLQLFVLFISVLPYFVSGQSFSPGNLAVLRVGSGVGVLSSSSSADFIVEYTTSGVATGTVISLPSSGASITNSGFANSEGLMSLSAERDLLILAGYNAPAGYANVVASAASAVSRVLYKVNSQGVYTLVATTNTNYSGNNIRSGTSSGGNYFSSGTPPGLALNEATQLTPALNNTRAIQIFNGQTYFSADAPPYAGVGSLGTGIPVTGGQTATQLNTVSLTNAYGFSLSPDGNTMYIASDSAGILKYSKSGGVYVPAYLLNNTQSRGIVVDYSGVHPVVYATTAITSGNAIIMVTDAGTGGAPATTLATAPANTVFRGIMFSPSCFATVTVTGPTTVCSGDSSTLLISGNPTGVVSYNINGGTTQTATISDNGSVTLKTGALSATATYQLLSINTPSCASAPLSGSAVITVNPLPSPITGATVCVSASTTLTEMGTGAWESSNASVATIGSSSGLLNGISAGTCAITYTLPTGCQAFTIATVNPLPDPINSLAPVCSDSMITATDATMGGTWTSGTTSAATIGSLSGSIAGIEAGSSIITYTLSTGCFATTSVAVNALPHSITGISGLCIGSTTLFSDPDPGGNWMSSNGLTATAGTDGTITGTGAGIAAVTYTLPTGCAITTPIIIYPLPGPITGANALCADSSITVADDTTGGAWSSNNTLIATVGTSGNVTGVGPGTAIISYTSENGCLSTQTLAVNPMPDAISGPTAVCEFSQADYSDHSTDGTWSCSSSVTASIGSLTGALTGMAPGTETVTYTLTTGCASVLPVVVNPLPGGITGPAGICQGSSVTLHELSTGGTWSSSNAGVVPVSTSGVINSLTTGTAIITYTAGTGCYTTLTITVDPLPANIGGASDICVGRSVTLSESTPGGNWSSSNTGVAVIGPLSGQLNGILQGTAIITYQLPTGCFVTSPFLVNGLPSPISGNHAICVGTGETLGDTGPGSWTSGNPGVASVGTTSGTVMAVAAGTAMISFMAGSGCFATTLVTVNPLPGAISGSPVLCTGSSELLMDGYLGGSWTSSTIGTAVIGTTGLVTAIAPGTAIVSYTLPTGCMTTMTITVSLPPVITGLTSICEGTSATLTESGTGTWESGNTAVAIIGSGTGEVTAVSAGTAVISYEIAPGCVAYLTEVVDPVPSAIVGDSAICTGTSTTYTDALSGGSWLSSNALVAMAGSGTGTVSAITPGVCLISYVLPTGCLRSSTVTVLPVPDAISGATAVCLGSTMLLSDSGAGTWTSSNGNAAIGSTTGNLTGISTGTAMITYRFPNSCYALTTLTVLPIPGEITGDAAICQGASSLLTDTSGGGTWSSSNVSIATIGSAGLMTGIHAGTVTISYQLATGCSVISTATINPIPSAIAGTTGICVGQHSLLTDSGTGSWSSSNTFVASIGSLSGYLSGLVAGTATVTFAFSTGCFTTGICTVNPLPAVITGDSSVCNGLTGALTDITAGGSWISGDPPVATVSGSGILSGISPGTAVITYLLPTGCSSDLTVSIMPRPSPIMGVFSVCTGNSTTLTDTTALGTWISGDTTVVTIDSVSGIASGVSAGTILISYQLNTGCYTDIIFDVDAVPAAISGLGEVCAGSNISLSETTGGTWTSSNTAVALAGSTGVITGVSEGTVTITFSTGASCFTQATVTVNPLPAAISGGPAVCKGTSQTLTDVPTGGSWGSSDPGIAAVGSVTGIVTGVAAGTCVISYTLHTGCGVATIIAVSLAPGLGKITGPNGICVGSSATLTDTVAGGVWSTSNETVADISAAGVVTALAPGNDTVSYLVTNGCGSALSTFILKVAATPDPVHISIFPDSMICTHTQFQNFGTNVAPQPGTNYIWSAFNAQVYAISSDMQNCLVSFVAPGTSYVILSSGIPGTQCLRADTIAYRVSEAVAPEINVVYYSPEFVCNDNTANGYQWGYDNSYTLDSTLLPGEINQNYYNPNPDLLQFNYWVLTDHGGCLQKSYYNAPEKAGNESIKNKSVIIYPNPTDSKISLVVSGVSASDVIHAAIWDVQGREMAVFSFSGGTFEKDVSALVPGVYFMVVSSDNGNPCRIAFVKD